MVAVDTNVLVRLLVRDDARQAARAEAVFRKRDIWIAKTVVIEADWVLRKLYGSSREDAAQALSDIGGLPNVVFEDSPLVAQALAWTQRGLEFADALHLASSGAASSFLTFDKKLAKRAVGAVSVPVECI